MQGFLQLLQSNRNYRLTWMGQVVSEVGDHFNNIAVFSLVMANTGSGMMVSGVMLSRAVPVIFAGPLAGVLLDRMDRRHLMIASDLVRAVIAALFVFGIGRDEWWLLFILSGLLMFASPFFSSGRAAILPAIATPGQLHTANSLTQTTQWTTTAIGGLLAGIAVDQLGYQASFLLNSLSFVFSAICIMMIRARTGTFRAAERGPSAGTFREYREGLAYIRSMPLILAIALIHVGWATGGGAAQVLFTLFGEKVYNMGARGIGVIWGFAGIGLVLGGVLAHRIGPRLTFSGYKRTVAVAYLVHGLSYVAFSLAPTFGSALFLIALSRGAVAVSSVLNTTKLLTHTADGFRGRVFATMETVTWGMMLISMTGAGLASEHYSARQIGVCAGLLSSTTAVYWSWASLTGRLPEPVRPQ